MRNRSKNWQRAFVKHNCAWQNSVARDPRLTGNERNIGIHLARNYLNGETMTAWPSHGTIASDLSVSVKTVQRALKKLVEFGYLEIGRRRRNSNTYEFASIRQAVEREVKSTPESGQDGPADRTRRSRESGHQSPTNLIKEHIKEPYARPMAPRCGISRFEPGSTNARDWNDALSTRGLNSLNAWKVRRRSPDGTQEYEMPHLWPPRDEDEWPIVEQYLAWRGAATEREKDC